MIVLENVWKKHGKTEVLRNLSLTVQPKEFVCLTGPSGSGKSTVLHLILGAELADKGRVEVDNVDIRTVPKRALQLYRRRVGCIYQDYKLLWNRTVRENIAFPLELYGMQDKIIKSRVEELLGYLDLKRQADTIASALSGGERARTALARAIVHKPMIILADEPINNVEPEEAVAVAQVLKNMNAEGSTVVLSTSDRELASALNVRTIGLDAPLAPSPQPTQKKAAKNAPAKSKTAQTSAPQEETPGIAIEEEQEETPAVQS